MKRVLAITTVSVGVLLLSGYGGYQYLVNKHEKENLEVKEKADAAGITEEEFIEQTQQIEGISYKVDLDENSTQEEVIDVMHKMTHQKVRAEQKWGAIPMIPETINDVYEIVSKSSFERKESLLEILERWKNGDFSKADEDHNYFWTYQGGTVGKAYGIMSKNEEAEFIKNNFKEMQDS
ncbi:DUF6241 domain-containing protein [Siminovitchia fortis]|uniref:Uncharacterized protein n=1 Tax=Siminovitchia fortis TaxID=254758 RepID=A0A443IVK9_9BACI|nr:DUF6241 domain-containing protein [Siminovitchia fortis]RWR12169.1 hypothetical protein D4N35_007300 [Siminovitchia fortis]WHY80995.1 DUF6241 domain-containing protein [Siminovitchia fortis]